MAQEQLHDVQQLSASSNAFCAVLGDGHCITWGDPGFGGDSSGSDVSVEKMDGLDLLQMLRTENDTLCLVAHPTARKWVITPVIYMG